jgi:hypothetical protein
MDAKLQAHTQLAAASAPRPYLAHLLPHPTLGGPQVTHILLPWIFLWVHVGPRQWATTIGGVVELDLKKGLVVELGVATAQQPQPN